MEFINYVRRPFAVEAIEITTDNLQEVADLIGRVETKGGITHIVPDRRIVPNISKVYVGWFLTRLGENYRCYAARVFKSQFIEHDEVIAFSFTEDDEEEEGIDNAPPHGYPRPDNQPQGD